MSHFSVDYYVNKEKKVVVAKLTNCFNGLICDMCHKGWPGNDEFLIPDEFVGKAKCCDSDIFDEEKGKKIAFKRAYKKFVSAKLKALTAFQDKNNAIINMLNNDIDEICGYYVQTCNKKDEEIIKIIED